MFKKDFWEKYSINSTETKSCSICNSICSNYLSIQSANDGLIILCKSCGIDSDAATKETYIKSLNEMHLEKDLLLDKILVYEKYINSNGERKSDFDKFKEQWELRKDIRNIDG